MDLPEEAIIEFQQIYEEEYGEKINFDEAKKRGENLVSLYKTVLKTDLKHSEVTNK